MGNLSLKNMCGNDNTRDEKSEMDTIKDREIKVKSKPNVIITDHGTEIKCEVNPKSRLPKYYNHFKKRFSLSHYINKWRLENLHFYLKGEIK